MGVDEYNERYALRRAIEMRELSEEDRNRLIREAGNKVYDLRPFLAALRR